MASQVSPGVVVKERDLSNAVVVGASSITGAFASSFRTGPVGKIVSISSERQLIDTFGTPAEANASDWLVASEFLRYGGRLAVVRAASGVKNATASGTGALIASKDDFDAGATTEKFAARYAGADGNNLRVVIVDRGADYTVTKNAHGWAVGASYTDGNGTAHEIVSVTANTADIIQNGAVAPTATGGATVAAFDWNAQAIGSTGLTYKSIAPRPGTSAFASERYLSNDEVHIAVIDESNNTVVERQTYLSKLSDGKTPEGGSSYWKDAVNEFSNYVYAGADLGASEHAAQGENSGSTAASYGATSGSPVELARILPTAGGALSGGVDDYAYTAGEIQTAYNEFLDTEQTTVDFVIMGGSMASENDTSH